jgi:hypothetical protein
LSIRGRVDRGDDRSVVGCPEEAVIKYAVYKDPWDDPARYEVRTDLWADAENDAAHMKRAHL